MSPTTSLDKYEEGKPVDKSKYQGMIGTLLYLTASYPDIMFSVCRCARFEAAPNESHLTAVKRIIRYFIGTTSHGLWYPRLNNFKLECFSVAVLVGDKDDRKSTSGTYQLLEKSLISWNRKKQGSIALSTNEAEYIAIGQCCAQLFWMMHQLSNYDLSFKTVKLFGDNSSAICLSKNSVHYSRAKHKDIKHHFIRDHVLKGDIELSFFSTENQLADIFTKPPLEDNFQTLRNLLGIITF
ncbi:secreted RxLR effector protein 161-like [Nicotiana tabacum]|uniref:Secreted RxLR effector protein 161-like n=1 Tax=Nicotiana tabacum TaxID=4097 RepID=A0AC58SCK0_TOBAC